MRLGNHLTQLLFQQRTRVKVDKIIGGRTIDANYPGDSGTIGTSAASGCWNKRHMRFVRSGARLIFDNT
jgi:hypothetical protein